MNKKIANQLSSIFYPVEKWDAFWDIYTECDKLIVPWITTGARAVREIYKASPEDGWSCEEWGLPRDTRWFLSEYGENSVGFGFGWDTIELHLHLPNYDENKHQRASELLKSSNFPAIQQRFAGKPNASKKKDGSIAWNNEFNPYPDITNCKTQRIAWRAQHDSKQFAETMLHAARGIMRDIKKELIQFNSQLNSP
jgi:hypothetical protein